MVVIDNWDVVGIDHAIRGMRNPLNSWAKSDSEWESGNWCDSSFHVGENDSLLMGKLAKAGTDHRKYMRMITVYADITAPIYWWKEYDTYKVGTVANSCSTMHTIAKKPLTIDDFSHEHLSGGALELLEDTVNWLNHFIKVYNAKNNDEVKKTLWYSIIQLLPSSFNQKRTVMLNYEVLANMYHSRKNHKLDEWKEFCRWVETLPYFNETIGATNE